MSKRKKLAKYPMALVVWTDASFDMANHWSDGDRPAPPKARDHVCLTIGWLTHIDDDFVQVVQTISDGQHAHVANIPRGMVREITALTGEGV